jgi:Domain of unknown function (DUF4440)
MNSSETLSCYGCNLLGPKPSVPNYGVNATSWLPWFVSAGQFRIVSRVEAGAAISRSLGSMVCRSAFHFALLLTILSVVQFGAGQTKHENGSEISPQMKAMFEAKIKAEWEALKNKDKESYGALLADDFQGVEVDGKGERSKIQAINELPQGNVQNYTLWGFKEISLAPDAAFVIYEVTMQFPPKSVVRYSRVYISELWVKRGDDWKELHYQETHVK